tara:strand:+ start:302 stop:745 length:444 start_codon:yes stop_codon:yes gene_type:complete
MKIILTTNIKKLGKMGDQVSVKDGFARNYLLPNKLALRDTKKNMEYYEKIKENIMKKEEQKKQNAINLIEEAKKIKIIFTKEADEKDQLYGAVSKKEIINLFNEKGLKIISDDLKISKEIKSIGEHLVEINPYEDLSAQIKITVNKN